MKLDLCSISLAATLCFQFNYAGADTLTSIADTYGQADNVWDAQISPNGEYVALGCSPDGWPAICVYDLREPEKPRVLKGAEGIRMLNFYWASDKHIISNSASYEQVNTSAGLRHFEFRRAISFDVTSGDYTILLKNVGLYLDTSQVVSTCHAKPNTVMMQLIVRASNEAPTGSIVRNTRAGFRSQYYEVDLNSGRGKLINHRNTSIVGMLVDQHCKPVIDIFYNDQRGEFGLETANNRRRFFDLQNSPVWPMDVIGLSDDKRSVIVRADYTDHYGLHRISLSDGTIEPIRVEGKALGNVGVLRDEERGTITGFSYLDDLVRHSYIDPDLHKLQTDLESALGKLVRIQSMSSSRSMMTISAETAGEPLQFFLYDARNAELSSLGSIAPHLIQKPQSRVEVLNYTARDGLSIQAYVVFPPEKQISDGPFPVLIMPHGGPESRDDASFDWWSHAYAAAGYVVIRPNFRGSSGYGSDFRNAGFGEFGGKMIEDIIDAVDWAQTSGLSSDNRACIVGSSYGGYAALMGSLLSDKIACVVAVSPVTDIFAHMARYDTDSAAYNYWARYAGGNKFSSAAMRASITPISRIDEYKVPIMLIHGKSDWVVQISQSHNFVRAWGAKPGLTFIELDGQDHHLRSEKARKEVLSKSLQFLNSHHPAVN